MNKNLGRTEITEALKCHRFKSYMQFIVDKDTEDIYGAEVLSRLEHPEKGILLPEAYVEEMEREGSIRELDLCMFEAACKQLAAWRDGKYADLRLFCNFTRMTISEEGFMDRIRGIFEKFDFDHQRLVMEITEDTEESNLEMALRNITQCKAEGFRIAIDDMGAGCTSLGDLRTYPVDYVKIDKATLDAAVETNNLNLLNAIVAVSHDLGICVLCEGVETERHKEILQNTECNLLQGFYYSRAIPQEEADGFLERYKAC